MNDSGTMDSKFESGIFSPEIQAAIRDELAVVLSSPAFTHSNRCKRFLSHVVLQALAGRGGELKERTIGINVFDRANDYDTGVDSIVRVTSNEVRKRIGQFYVESQGSHIIQIELPRGSYVPEFRIHPGPSRVAPPSLQTELPVTSQPVLEDPALPSEASQAAAAQTGELALKVHQQGEGGGEAVSRRSHKTQLTIVILIVALAAAISAFSVYRGRAQKKGPEVWEEFQRAGVPVLICIGTHDIPPLTMSVAAKEEAQTFDAFVLRREVVPVDDVRVTASLASLLGTKGIRFRIVGADQASLTDLRRQPVILIGGADNKWTLRLTQNLRYRIEFVPPDVSKRPTASIIDSEYPKSNPWRFDFSVPMDEWKNDYAIVARVDDPATGVPVLINAGLGNPGSLAASELVASDTLPRLLASDPGCRAKTNFEAVVGTEIIDAKPGPPHVLRLQCW